MPSTVSRPGPLELYLDWVNTNPLGLAKNRNHSGIRRFDIVLLRG